MVKQFAQVSATGPGSVTTMGVGPSGLAPTDTLAVSVVGETTVTELTLIVVPGKKTCGVPENPLPVTVTVVVGAFWASVFGAIWVTAGPGVAIWYEVNPLCPLAPTSSSFPSNTAWPKRPDPGVEMNPMMAPVCPLSR